MNASMLQLRAVRWWFVGVGLLWVVPAGAMFVELRTKDVPVARLIKNTLAYVEKHPADVGGWYTLGRLNYLAFESNTIELQLNYVQAEPPAGDADTLIDSFAVYGPRIEMHGSASADVRRENLIEAIKNLRKALQMQPKNEYIWNTFGSALEQGASYAQHLTGTNGLPPGDEVIESPPAGSVAKSLSKLARQYASRDRRLRDSAAERLTRAGCSAVPALWAVVSQKSNSVLGRVLARCWKDRAIEAYGRAFDLALPDGLPRRAVPVAGTPARELNEELLQVLTAVVGSRLAPEAGENLLRLMRERGVRPREAARVAEVEKGIGAVRSQPQAMTPIIFSLDSAKPLSALVSPNSVHFDLDGSGRGTRWDWLQPTTGLLVWDARRTGRITSGQQLLGAVAFEMFWRNGYAALDALDDNRDGLLSGPELAGLAVWFDRNSNGVSDPGEVIPVETLGITGLAAAAVTGVDGDAPMNARGLFLRDGRVLPTYDWISHEVPELAAKH